jgi:hypothetical protein
VAFQLKLPTLWENRGWKVKIRDRERVEPPHVTIMHKVKSWRFGLRSQQFLDKKPDPSDVPDEVIEAVRENVSMIRATWDRMYPENPIVSKKPKANSTRKHK